MAAAAESDDFVAGITFWGFPGGSDRKESACHAGDPCSVPGLGRFPGEGDGYSLQYSCLAIHGHHRMVNTKVRLIIFFAAKDGEALYSQQKQDQELIVIHIMNSLLPNSDLN